MEYGEKEFEIWLHKIKPLLPPMMMVSEALKLYKTKLTQDKDIIDNSIQEPPEPTPPIIIEAYEKNLAYLQEKISITREQADLLCTIVNEWGNRWAIEMRSDVRQPERFHTAIFDLFQILEDCAR